MDKITTQQAAKKWKMSVRNVQDLCKRGRIPGAEQYGRNWMIPEDALKPVDKRKRTQDYRIDKEDRLQMPRESPHLNMTDIYKEPGTFSECIEEITDNPSVKLLYKGWVSYVLGDIEQAAEIGGILLEIESDFYGRISVGLLLVACALWKGDIILWRRGRTYLSEVPVKDEREIKIRDFWIAATEISTPDSLEQLDQIYASGLEALPEDSIPSAHYFYAKNLHALAKKVAREEAELQDIKGMGLIRLYPYMIEPMIAEAKRKRIIFVEIGLRLMCAECYYNLNGTTYVYAQSSLQEASRKNFIASCLQNTYVDASTVSLPCGQDTVKQWMYLALEAQRQIGTKTSTAKFKTQFDDVLNTYMTGYSYGQTYKITSGDNTYKVGTSGMQYASSLKNAGTAINNQLYTFYQGGTGTRDKEDAVPSHSFFNNASSNDVFWSRISANKTTGWFKKGHYQAIAVIFSDFSLSPICQRIRGIIIPYRELR